MPPERPAPTTSAPTLTDPTPSARALPTGVRPVDGETPSSVFTRLAAANGITPAALWGHLRTLDPGLPYAHQPDRCTGNLEQLAGIRAGWFAEQHHRYLVPRRCPHNRWELAVCATCSHLPAPRAGCVRCAGGQSTEVSTRDGLVCLTHGQYTDADLRVDVREDADYLIAERSFRTQLAGRGVTTGSGELHLAVHLLAWWTRNDPAPHLTDRADQAPSPGSDSARVAFSLYPEAVSLTGMLTDPGFVSYLLSPTWGPATQAALLTAAVRGVLDGDPDSEFLDRAHTVIAHGRRAVIAAYGMVGASTSRRNRGFERALAGAAVTHRACLLRHIDTIRLPNTPAPRGGRPAPTNFRITRAAHAPDEDLTLPAPDATTAPRRAERRRRLPSDGKPVRR